MTTDERWEAWHPAANRSITLSATSFGAAKLLANIYARPLSKTGGGLITRWRKVTLLGEGERWLGYVPGYEDQVSHELMIRRVR